MNILDSQIGKTIKTWTETDEDRKNRPQFFKFVKEKFSQFDTATSTDDKARILKEMYEFFIDKEVFKNPYYNHSLKFRAIVWNKLNEFEHTNSITGTNNPKEWVPVVRKKLSFLYNICKKTGKTSSTNWIP